MASAHDLQSRARGLYAQGATLDEIADLVERSVRTVERWRSADADAGLDWDQLRDDRRRLDPTAYLATLLTWRSTLTQGGKPDAGVIDALYKIQRIIDKVREEAGDISTILAVQDRFARWAVDNLSPKDLATARRFVADFTADLREESSRGLD